MVTSAKSSVPTVKDQAAAMQLGQCAKNLATCLAELRTAAQKVPTHSHAVMWLCMHDITAFHTQTTYKNKHNTLTSSWEDAV